MRRVRLLAAVRRAARGLRQQAARTRLADERARRPGALRQRVHERQRASRGVGVRARPQRTGEHRPARPGGPGRTDALRAAHGQPGVRALRRVRAAARGFAGGGTRLRRLPGRHHRRRRTWRYCRRSIARPHRHRAGQPPSRASRIRSRALSPPVSCSAAAKPAPELLVLAAETASAQGWRRPLLAWLGVAAQRAEQAGAAEEAQRLRRRMALAAGER